MTFHFVLCRLLSSNCFFPIFALLIVLEMVAQPEARLPNALSAVKMGTIGKKPPIFGTLIVRGILFFF